VADGPSIKQSYYATTGTSYFAFLHVEVVDDNTDEKVESEKRAEDNEEDEE